MFKEICYEIQHFEDYRVGMIQFPACLTSTKSRNLPARKNCQA
jgi:hypothetical protein